MDNKEQEGIDSFIKKWGHPGTEEGLVDRAKTSLGTLSVVKVERKPQNRSLGPRVEIDRPLAPDVRRSSRTDAAPIVPRRTPWVRRDDFIREIGEKNDAIRKEADKPSPPPDLPDPIEDQAVKQRDALLDKAGKEAEPTGHGGPGNCKPTVKRYLELPKRPHFDTMLHCRPKLEAYLKDEPVDFYFPRIKTAVLKWFGTTRPDKVAVIEFLKWVDEGCVLPSAPIHREEERQTSSVDIELDPGIGKPIRLRVEITIKVL